MKIDLLWRREPFAELFADAAARLLAAAGSGAHEIGWRARAPALLNERDWICAGVLNAIYWARAPARTRAVVRRQYGHHQRRLRAAAQRLYVAAATRGLGERVLARWLTITPRPASAPDMVFRGGGRRIRMMDVARARVWTVAKAGCGARGVSTELAFRRALPPGFPAPALGEVIDGGRGFWEQLAPGVPLDQISGPRAAEIRAAAERRLGELARAGRRRVSAASYLSGLAARVEFDLASDLASPVVREVVAGVFDAIAARLGGGEIAIAPCHGDLTGDNIIATGAGGSFAITDWETAGERHEGFTWIEAAASGVRRPGFGHRLAALVVTAPGPEALAAARRLLADPAAAGDRGWRRQAVLVYLAERLVIDAGTALSGHLRRVGPELALSASEAELALEALGP